MDPEATADLRTLPGDLAEVVARLLVATSVTEDPKLAFEYAKKARGLAARVGIVRETCAIAAYQAGDWNAALAEFRAARRLTGRISYLPLMADCERALGRLDRALDLVASPEAKSADQQTRVELRIVESGIRRDQGLADAAVVALQMPELTDGRTRPALARLYYAYADALLNAGRGDEAREWFGRAAEADVDDETDAAERCAAEADVDDQTDAAERCDELDDISLEDLELGALESDDETGEDQAGEPGEEQIDAAGEDQPVAAVGADDVAADIRPAVAETGEAVASRDDAAADTDEDGS